MIYLEKQARYDGFLMIIDWIATPSNDEFDTIFGGSTAKKNTAPTKSRDSAKSTQKAAVKNISAAPNDEFDSIFGKGK